MSVGRVAALLVAIIVAVVPVTGHAGGQDASPESSLDTGRQLYVRSCASCHGVSGRGTENGPTLEKSGSAAVDFQLRTGRMPLDKPGGQPLRKDPAFDSEQIAALVEYASTFGTGPEIPDVDPDAASVSDGQELFVANCAPCHGSAGNGGAVGGTAFAPSLLAADSVEVAEAVLVGPGEMPVFDFDPHELDALARYISFVQSQRDPGGLDIGGVGPVPEGFVAWIVGAGVLVLICVVLGRKRNEEKT